MFFYWNIFLTCFTSIPWGNHISSFFSFGVYKINHLLCLEKRFWNSQTNFLYNYDFLKKNYWITAEFSILNSMWGNKDSWTPWKYFSHYKDVEDYLFKSNNSSSWYCELIRLNLFSMKQASRSWFLDLPSIPIVPKYKLMIQFWIWWIHYFIWNSIILCVLIINVPQRNSLVNLHFKIRIQSEHF